jgi:tight adherence protein B
MIAQISMLNILLAAAAFVLVASLWLVVALVWSIRSGRSARRVRERIGLARPQANTRELRLWHEGKEATTTVPGRRPSKPLVQRLEELCADAGWRAGLRSLGMGLVGGCLLAYVIMYTLTGAPLVSAIAPGTVLAGFWIVLQQRIVKQEALFEKQLLDALDLATRSLRAGHPLMGAFQVISQEIAAPAGSVFAKICQQQAIGVGLEEALRGAAAESHSPDLKLFATSVAIQIRTGGSLTDMMERLSAVIRNRMWLTRRVRVLTAQTQFSKRLLLVMPFVVFLALNLINPKYMKPLYATTDGQWLLLISGACLFTGAWVMNRLAILKY